MAKKIFIGRNPSSDYAIPQTFNKVSNNHAEIEENNGHLFFIDHSSNGTLINGQWVFNTRVEITDGDDIRLANTYHLTWDVIHDYFPDQLQRTRPIGYEERGRKTQLHDSGANRRRYDNYENDFEKHRERNSYFDSPSRTSRDYRDAEIKSWNWGAFLLGWIWAVGHSIVWPLFAILGGIVILVLLPCLFPPLLTVTIPIYNILLFALAIYLGAKGSSLAWDNGCFESIEHFKQKERNWTIAGLIVWGIGLFVFIITIIIWFSAITSFFALL